MQGSCIGAPPAVSPDQHRWKRRFNVKRRIIIDIKKERAPGHTPNNHRVPAGSSVLIGCGPLKSCHNETWQPENEIFYTDVWSTSRTWSKLKSALLRGSPTSRRCGQLTTRSGSVTKATRPRRDGVKLPLISAPHVKTRAHLAAHESRCIFEVWTQTYPMARSGPYYRENSLDNIVRNKVVAWKLHKCEAGKLIRAFPYHELSPQLISFERKRGMF